MTRSLLILVVTIIVVAASYYGFSRLGATSAARVDAAAAAAPRTADATVPAAAGEATSASNATPAGTSASETSSASHATPAGTAGAQSAAPPIAAGTTDASAPNATAPGTFSIVIDRAHPPAPSDVIRVDKDVPVTLTITSDRAGHLEVHGYREEVAVEPGKTATLSFKAARTGRFPIDLHAKGGAHIEVTALEVMPR